MEGEWDGARRGEGEDPYPYKTISWKMISLKSQFILMQCKKLMKFMYYEKNCVYFKISQHQNKLTFNFIFKKKKSDPLMSFPILMFYCHRRVWEE